MQDTGSVTSTLLKPDTKLPDDNPRGETFSLKRTCRPRDSAELKALADVVSEDMLLDKNPKA